MQWHMNILEDTLSSASLMLYFHPMESCTYTFLYIYMFRPSIHRDRHSHRDTIVKSRQLIHFDRSLTSILKLTLNVDQHVSNVDTSRL